jgi:hypothetical protein
MLQKNDSNRRRTFTIEPQIKRRCLITGFHKNLQNFQGYMKGKWLRRLGIS